MAATNLAVSTGELADLVSQANTGVTVIPSDDAILAVLQARFRSDHPYTRISTSNLVVVNPYKALANTNDASAREYEERCYRDTSLSLVRGAPPLQPHLFDMAARMYLLMRRRNESQSVVFRGITGSGKTASSRLFVDQILRMSTHSKREIKLGEQIKSLYTLLDAFGNAKTVVNPNASRHGRYLELHFNDRGRIDAAKVLTFALDKSRLNKLSHEERTFHVFYQLLAGATPDERDHLGLEDPSDYALLASSGCYRLPSGPFSDDNIAMEDLRAAMRLLGFKQKHMSAILSLLTAILVLGNIQFSDGDYKDTAAFILNQPVVDQAAQLLGVPSEELGQILTNKTSYVRKELYSVLLDAAGARSQRDQFVRDLYAILFAFVVEHANHRIAPSAQDPPPLTQIVIFDQAGFQSRAPTGTGSMMLGGPAPLLSIGGQNGFDEFCINFADELLASYIFRNTFDDTVGLSSQLVGDGVALPQITTMDNSACIELLRGAQLSERASRKPAGVIGAMNKAALGFKSGKSGDNRDAELLQDLVAKFGVHASFVASPGGAGGRNMFGINHYAGSCSYDVSAFVEKDTDLLDPSFVTLLRSSSEGFVAKLLSGPSMATERHHNDDSILVQAQVSSRPLRQPTPILAPDGSTGEEFALLDPAKVYPVTTQENHVVSELLHHLSQTRLWTVSCIRPNDSGSPNSFDKRRVKAQIKTLLLPDFLARKKGEFSVEFEPATFCSRYVPTMQGEDEDRIRQCAQSNGWKEGVDYTMGHRAIWLTYAAWKVVEDVVRSGEREGRKQSGEIYEDEDDADDVTDYTHEQGAPSPRAENPFNNVVSYAGSQRGRYDMPTPQLDRTPAYSETGDSAWDSSWDKKAAAAGGNGPPPDTPILSKEGSALVANQVSNTVEEVPSSRTRRVWLWVVWVMTGYIPTFLLEKLGRMKRPDIRLAWREKLTICLLILLLNGIVVFYIVEFGRLLCPRFDKAWSINEVGQHTDDDNYWVAIQGYVYDVSDYIHADHSDIKGQKSNTGDVLEGLAGTDLTPYFPVPLALACPGLVSDSNIALQTQNVPPFITAMHTTGNSASAALSQKDWYTTKFLPKIKKYRKGPLVITSGTIKSAGANETDGKTWAIYKNLVYDLTDYLYTQDLLSNDERYEFLNEDIVDVFKQQSGKDITKNLNKILDALDSTERQQNLACLNNAFYVGEKDFRKSPRCQVNNYLLLVASSIIMASMGIKFLAALQLAPKRTPELLDKFVICQIPCYTEGEDSLRRTIDSLSALKYDDKRKLLFVICDGNIIGSGNDRTTPRIVLDILGVDPKLDPEPLLFKSIGEGSKQLNYGKVYSGLYEFEGHIVPYMVVVKVGKPTERSKPGNRGKRDSQILLMHYLNRVHFDSPMSPLELEIYHQMRNVIGIDPAFYEYIFTVDADTTVTPDSLNRLVATSADDQAIIGICGETRLENPEGSWWTMIQVYEYYISHNLSKAFESLFGSVTCLPGCFSLYRIRTADKGRPIIISNRIIDEYAEPVVDTLHKKNLFSLGEDRYLTTLLMKHFPTFKTKFIPDAIAHTVAPDSWRVLLSQRRRWINSTVHNLCELILLPELFGFCCFSMRFFVFIDLLGTLILPATVVYLGYLIYTCVDGAAIPVISLAMIAAVYGLQALIFILRREFMLIGWMVVYILSYPVYSFFLPVYSFWCMDDFGWGNTRLVIGEGKDKKVIVNEDDKFDDSMIPLKRFSEYEAEAWETQTHHTGVSGYPGSRSPSRAPGSRSRSPDGFGGSQAGDYYRDTNKVKPQRTGGSRLRSQPSNSNMSQYGQQQSMSQFAAPQLPFMPFAGGPGSVAGSEYGGQMPIGMPYQQTGGSMYGMMMPQHTGSVYGMPPPSMMGMGMYGGADGSQSVVGGPSMARPMSTFSMATSVNAFAGPSQNANPTDDELFNALRIYLSTQDLMTVTKKTAREAIASRFPKADLSTRKDFLNESIDKILSQA